MWIKILQEHFFPEKCDQGDSMWALACEQVLRGRNRNESLQLRLWNLNSPSNSPMAPHWLSCQISTNQHEVEMSVKVNKHWETPARGNDVTTNVISTNQHFTWTFSMQIFKFRRRRCKLSFLFPPRHRNTPENLLTGYVGLCDTFYRVERKMASSSTGGPILADLGNLPQVEPMEMVNRQDRLKCE